MLKFLHRQKSAPAPTNTDNDPYASPSPSASPSYASFAYSSSPSIASHSPSPQAPSFRSSHSYSSSTQQGGFTNSRSSPSPPGADSAASSRPDLQLPTPLYAKFARSASGTDLRLDFLDQDPAMNRGARSAADAYAQSWHRGRSGLGKQVQPEGEDDASTVGRGQRQGQSWEQRKGKDLPPPPARSPAEEGAAFALPAQRAMPRSYHPPANGHRVSESQSSSQVNTSDRDGNGGTGGRGTGVARSVSAQYKTEEFVHSASEKDSREAARPRQARPKVVAINPATGLPYPPARSRTTPVPTPAAVSLPEPVQVLEPKDQHYSEALFSITKSPPKGKLVKPGPRGESLRRTAGAAGGGSQAQGQWPAQPAQAQAQAQYQYPAQAQPPARPQASPPLPAQQPQAFRPQAQAQAQTQSPPPPQRHKLHHSTDRSRPHPVQPPSNAGGLEREVSDKRDERGLREVDLELRGMSPGRGDLGDSPPRSGLRAPPQAQGGRQALPAYGQQPAYSPAQARAQGSGDGYAPAPPTQREVETWRPSPSAPALPTPTPQPSQERPAYTSRPSGETYHPRPVAEVDVRRDLPQRPQLVTQPQPQIVQYPSPHTPPAPPQPPYPTQERQQPQPQPFPTTPAHPLTPPHSPIPPPSISAPAGKRSFLFVSGGKVEPLHPSRGNVPLGVPSPPEQPSPTSPLSGRSGSINSGTGGGRSGSKKLLKKRGSSKSSNIDFEASPSAQPGVPQSPLRPVDGASVAPSLASKRNFAPGSFRGPGSPAGGGAGEGGGGGGVFGFVRRLSESRSSSTVGSTGSGLSGNTPPVIRGPSWGRSAGSAVGGGVSAAAEEAQVRIRMGRRRSEIEEVEVDELRRMLERDAVQRSGGAGAGAGNMAGVGAGRRSLDAYGPGSGAGGSRNGYGQSLGAARTMGGGYNNLPASSSTPYVDRLPSGRSKEQQHPPQAFGGAAGGMNGYGHGRRAASEVDLRYVMGEREGAASSAGSPGGTAKAGAFRTAARESVAADASAWAAGGVPERRGTPPSAASTSAGFGRAGERAFAGEDREGFSGERTPTASLGFRQGASSALGAGHEVASSARFPPGISNHSSDRLDVPTVRRTPSPSGSSQRYGARSVAGTAELDAPGLVESSAASVYSQESVEKETHTLSVEGGEEPDAEVDSGTAKPHQGQFRLDVPGERGSVISLGDGSASEREAGDRRTYVSGSEKTGLGLGEWDGKRESTYKSPYLPSNASASEYDTAPEREERTPKRIITTGGGSNSGVAPLNDNNKALAGSPSTLRRQPARRQSTSSNEDLTLRSSVRGPREMDRPERESRVLPSPATPTQRTPASAAGAPPRPSTESTSGSETHTYPPSKAAAVSKTSSSASSYQASSENGAAATSASHATSVSPAPATRNRVDAGAVKPPLIPFPKSPERERGHSRRPSDPRYKLPPPRQVPPPQISLPPEECGPQTTFLPNILVEPAVLAQLLPYLSFHDFLFVLHINRDTRGSLGETRSLRELILERYLDTVGYHRWPRHLKRDEPITLSLKDLNAYLMGVSVATHQYASAAETYLQSQSRDPAVLSLCRSFTAATRSYTRVVLRLRAQAEAGWDSDALRSPLFRLGHAPLLRVFVPSPSGGWLSDESVVECEKELRRAGVMKLVRKGDVVWDAAVSDEGNIGRLIWDGNYLLDLEYDYSASGQLPHYFNSLAHPPSYWHKVIRTSANPIAFIDLRPYGKELVQNVQLVQDRVQMETPQGGYHMIVKYSHRSVARVLRGTPIPETKEVVDGGWDGRIVVEAEGTNEGLADLQNRCSARSGKGVYRIMREKSRPGEVWIRCVRPEEKIM